MSFAWLPSVSGSTTIRGRSFDDNARFIDIVRKSDSLLAFMGHVEAQKDNFGIFLEPIWMKLGFGAPKDILFTKLTTEIAYVEFGGFYRALQGAVGSANKPYFVDVLAGGRFTDIGAELSLSSLVGGSSVTQSVSWVDPFIGARARLEIAPAWDVQLRADIGGFGAGSNFSWNIVGLIGHRFPLFGAPVEAIVGFKALSQDYTTGSGNRQFKWDNILYGPVLGIAASF